MGAAQFYSVVLIALGLYGAGIIALVKRRPLMAGVVMGVTAIIPPFVQVNFTDSEMPGVIILCALLLLPVPFLVLYGGGAALWRFASQIRSRPNNN